MLGLMQDCPLLISSLIEHAARHHCSAEIVSRQVSGGMHRYCFSEAAQRSRRVAAALEQMGVGQDARVGTLAWNGYRHIELYYGITGSGRIVHTINPRLSSEQIVWIANHADDEVMCFDLSFLPVVQAIRGDCPRVKYWIALCEEHELPDSGESWLSYESWITGAPEDYSWPTFDERSAATLCYTSGTTGFPKGVLYSHRSTVLHTLAVLQPDAMACSARDVILPAVPMFHINAWGLPYVAAMVGAKLVLPGAALDGESLYELLEAEHVTLAAGVPAIWMGLLDYLERSGKRFSSLERTVIGGSVCTPQTISILQERYGVQVRHAWGMTETSALGTTTAFLAEHYLASAHDQLAVQSKQGRAIYGIDMKVVDEAGRELPREANQSGVLMVRGHWVAEQYYQTGQIPLVDGWLPTGDLARIDNDGYMQITDRLKDLIKSGGEWISSLEIERIAMAHPEVAMAACIAVEHPKWGERPLLLAVRHPRSVLVRAELLAFYKGRLADWQIPDDVVFLTEIPLAATGKVQKYKLRERFQNHLTGSGKTGSD